MDFDILSETLQRIVMKAFELARNSNHAVITVDSIDHEFTVTTKKDTDTSL